MKTRNSLADSLNNDGTRKDSGTMVLPNLFNSLPVSTITDYEA
jgi:hypothetical protein